MGYKIPNGGTFQHAATYAAALAFATITNANWDGGARDPAASQAREAFYLAVQKAVDDEAAAAPAAAAPALAPPTGAAPAPAQ